MVQAYLLTDLQSPIATYNTVYEYSKLEMEARKNTSLSKNIKAISAAVYINLRHSKHEGKVYSHLFRNHLQFRRVKA
jgi:hypothetical protein